jgi:purine-binding chemotaxis protein CheW
MSEAKKQTLDQTQYLTFQLAGEEYAVNILQVKEIIAYGTLTTVPQTPPSIRGVINLRGSVVPVVDLALKFGLNASPVTNRTCIVIVEVNMLPAPAFGTQLRMNFLQGMGKTEARFVLILNIDKALSGADADQPVSTAGAPAGFSASRD